MSLVPNQRRWQPPPLVAPLSGRKVVVDERVVRKMLQVNPELRQGRTTLQVKRAVEQGEGIMVERADAIAPRHSGPGIASQDLERELADTVGFFVRTKTQVLKQQLQDLARRRLELDAEEQRLLTAVREQLASFLSLLDGKILSTCGETVLARHGDLLDLLRTSPQSLLTKAARPAGGNR